jgi:hypothetical protein
MTELRDVTKGLGDLGRDTAYVLVGLGVLGFQRAQVERVELQRKFNIELPVDELLAGARMELARRIQLVDNVVETAFQIVETTIEPFEDQLPPVAREVTTRAREGAREVRGQIREVIRPD